MKTAGKTKDGRGKCEESIQIDRCFLFVVAFGNSVFFELWMLGIFKQPFSVYWALGISVIYLVALSSKYRKIRNLEKCFHSLGDKAEKADKENTEIKNKYENLKNEHENLKSEHET